MKALAEAGLDVVLYQDWSDPTGVGLFLMVEDPAVFAGRAAQLLAGEPFAGLFHEPRFTMAGRTYSTGREADLEDWLLRRPLRYALNPDWPWAIWYPLRRKPDFALLPKAEQGKILMEHAMLGKNFAEAGFAYDIRLSCYGLDTNDNEFVLGLLGPELYPLSRLVQEMRKTEQTARYIQSLGPFFVGKVIWRSHLAQT
jgi:chlorite dismutase